MLMSLMKKKIKQMVNDKIEKRQKPILKIIYYVERIAGKNSRTAV